MLHLSIHQTPIHVGATPPYRKDVFLSQSKAMQKSIIWILPQLFLKSFHPNQESKATKTQSVSECEIIKKRKNINEQKKSKKNQEDSR